MCDDCLRVPRRQLPVRRLGRADVGNRRLPRAVHGLQGDYSKLDVLDFIAVLGNTAPDGAASCLRSRHDGRVILERLLSRNLALMLTLASARSVMLLFLPSPVLPHASVDRAPSGTSVWS